MAPAKRKRPDQSFDGNRPSPHRPADTAMGQRGRDGYDGGGGRGGRGGGRNGRRNDRRDSTQNQAGLGAPYNHQHHASSPTTSRHQTPRTSAAVPPPAPPVEQPPPAAPAPAPAATLPAPISSNYPYEILTDDKIASWDSGSRQALIEHGVQSRQDVDITELSSLFQEFVQSVAEYRLNPTDAGACVKEILGPETKEVIKDSYSFEPHTLLLDTITIIMDNQPDLFIPEFRDFLIATAISPTLIRQVLDAPLLQKLGLIREVFGKMAIRHSTNMLYRQANYNLLREESEGYSKLVTELFSCVDDYDTPTTREAEAAFEKIKGLIGTFDLDVGRVLDVALDVHATSLVKASKFFVKLLRVSSWWPRSNTPFDAIIQGGLPDWALPLPSELDESAIAEVRRQRDIGFWERAREKQIQAFFELGGRRASEQDLERAAADNAGAATEGEAVRSWITATRTLPPQGNRVAAQLLGFKLRFYASDFREGQALPANLLYLAALLIKIGFISLIDLYAHLFPYDDDMESFRDKRIKQLEEKERESRGEASKNALLTAGALSDDTLPPPVRSRDTATRPKAASKPDQAEGVDKKEEDEPHEQKGALVISLLTIGAIPEALFLIGRWPWLLQGYPDITSRVNRILEYSIDKLYQETRPTTTSSMACPPKKVADSDQSGVAKGSVRRSEIPIRKSMRWPWPDGRLGVSDQHYRFYWDEWSDNVPVCQTVDDVFTLSSSLLNITGVNIGKSEQLLVMLASIGQKSLAEDQSKHNLDRWQDLLRRILVPALSRSKGAPATANLVWTLLKQYPIATRYSIYADWFEGAPNRGSEVRRAAMVKAFADTKSRAQGVMKRISKDNAVEMGRALAKLTHSSPGVVFKVALELMMSYGNLSDVFAECVRFFTDLTKDVMIWSLLSALGSNQRSRTQASYILSISPWLLELSKLTGKLFKRYRELDATPILRYVHDQLLHGNSTDLIILSELVDAMGGIVNTADIGYDEVIAMSGMALLQRRTLISLQDRRFEPAVIASSKRLTHALVDSRLAGRLLVNIAQFRQSATFRLSDDGAHVKYLSSLMDNSHQILVQYLDLLRANLDPAEFDRLVPSISQLMAEFGLDASFAFAIGRESLAAHIFSKPTTAPKQISQSAPDAEGDVSMGDDATATESAPDTTKPETPAPEAPGEAHVTAATSFDALNPIVESLRSTTPESAWKKISVEFFAIFWALQLGDLGVPWAPYHAQQARLQEQYRQVTKDRKLLQAQRSAKQKELKDTMDTFIKESTQQSERVAKAKVLITKRMDTWFMGEPLKSNGVSDAILEQCLLPRIILSKIDSEYSFALIKYIHELSCPNFRLMALYDRLFKANRLRGMLFTCTVQEGVYLGHFFHLILRELNKWHKSSADYEKEAIGKSKRSGGYLGFVTAFDEEGHPISHLDHAEFQDVLYGWHKNINLALKACLSGTEWTHIRNAISFLTEAHEDFPAVTFMGTQLQNQLKTIVAREKNLRGDLWLTAQRVLGNMAKMEKTWIAPQAFRTNLSTQSAAQGNEDEQASSSGGSLRATAPEFRPSAQNEDGEVQDGKASFPQRSTSTRRDAKGTPQSNQRDSPRLPVSTPSGPKPMHGALSHNRSSTPNPSETLPHAPGSSNRDPRQPNMPSNRNASSLPRGPGLPQRPPGPIPEHQPLNRFTPAGPNDRRDVRDHRDPRAPRDNRDVRESRDQRDARDSWEPKGGDVSRQESSRESSRIERRGPDVSTRDSGRLSEGDRPPRRDHLQSGREAETPKERLPQSTSQGPDIGRPGREAGTPAGGSTAAIEPPINPARAALFQSDTPSRTERPDRERSRARDGEQRGAQRHQGSGGPEHDRSENMNVERPVLFGDGRQEPLPRQPREDPRERDRAPRKDSPARGGRVNPDRLSSNPFRDAVRDEQFGRLPHPTDARNPRNPRDSRDPRDPRDHRTDDPRTSFQRGPERDGAFGGSDSNPTREAFLSRAERDNGRPKQDDQYGRLNSNYPIASVVDAPSGPRGRGARPNPRNNFNTPPPPPPRGDGRLPRTGSPGASAADDRHPPAGPSSGRGHRGQNASGSTPNSNAVTPSEGPWQGPVDTPVPSSRPSDSATVAPGVHPDRLAQMGPPPSVSAGDAHSRQPTSTPDRPLTSGQGSHQIPSGNFSGPAPDFATPTGPASGGGRKQGGRRQLEGINSTLQQAQGRPDPVKGTTIRGRSSRTNLANSDAQILVGGSPASTSAYEEHQDPLQSSDKRPYEGEEHGRGEHERGRRERDRSERSSRPSRRSSRERQRSPGGHERDSKDSRSHRDRRSGATGHGSSSRDEHEPRRSTRDPSGSNPRESQTGALPPNNRDGASRDSRHRGDRGDMGPGGLVAEEWNGSASRHQRSGQRDSVLRPPDDRRDPRDNSRKRRSEDANGFSVEKRQRR
ncbi:hypothetical protein VDGD_00613 [Verticillium dahliae]|nr:hypothetical protein VdG1_01760 [Verticillium dahliae VDG1]RBQ68535.1 hypothetical protein VDGD_00613 [Verticillium dahliae]